MVSETASGDQSVCSGSLISPTLFLAAAHCLDDAVAFYVTFKQDGPYSLKDDFVRGTAYQHPGWNGTFTVPKQAAGAVGPGTLDRRTAPDADEQRLHGRL
jgi:hypothetical protein